MKKVLEFKIIALLVVVIMVACAFTSRAEAAEAPSVPALLVKLKAGLTPAERTAVVARNGGIETSSIPALRLHVISVTNADDHELILAKYQADPQVERVEISKTRQAEGVPNDTFYDRQWALGKIGWDRVFGTTPSGNAVVALLDTGVNAGHPDLGEDVVLPGTSLLTSGSDGRTDPNGHGTWLAGIVGAVADNSEGIAGICYSGVKILPVTVLNENGIGNDGDIMAGIAWAVDHGADVILMGFSNADFSQSLQDVIDYAWEQGVVLVAAAGNAGVSIPTFPAGARGVMGVSATTEQDTLLLQSNYGEAVFLAAPGENILTANSDEQGLYTNVSGTSAASAVVAGVAAFMKAVDGNLTNGIIVGRLAKSADAIGTPGDPDNQVMFGNGRINMFNALASTDTAFIMPAGAAPVGNGGPYVGPYTAASGQFEVDASFSANTSTISAHAHGLVSNWIYQYAYKTPSGAITYHACTPGSGAGSDNQVLPSGFETGRWIVYLLAYNPSYQTCLDNGSATRTATTMTDVTVTTAYMSVAPVTGYYNGTVTLSASLTIGTPLSGKTIRFTLNGAFVGSAVTDAAGVATLNNAPLASINAGSYPAGVGASFAGDGTYSASSAVGSLTVNRAAPTITAWPSASAIQYGQILSEATLSGGNASVAGTFAFALPNYVPGSGIYSASVTFTPSDGNNYTAVSGEVSVTVNKLTPSVTAWPNASSLVYGQTLAESVLSGGTASVAGTFSFQSPTTIPVSGTISAAVIFTPDDPNYNTVNGSVDVLVSKATPTVAVWPAASGITFGETLSQSTLSGGSASVAGTFSFDLPSAVPNAGSYSAAVTFIPNDLNYNPQSGFVDVMVSKATPTVAVWPAASGITFGETLFQSTLSGGSASVAGTFSFDLPSAVPNAGSYNAAVTFTPTDSNYDQVRGSVTVTVNKLAPTVTAWPGAAVISYGQALSEATLSGGTASVAGLFSFAAPTFVPNAGTFSAEVIFTPIDQNYAVVGGMIVVTINKAIPTVTAWPAAADIAYGQALSEAALSGGNASVAGSFFFNAPDTMLHAGLHSVAVSFYPNDDSNYAVVSGSVNVQVLPAAQFIAFAALPDIVFGVTPFQLDATATSTLPVSFNSLTPTVCTIAGGMVAIADVGTCTIEALQPGSADYYPASPAVRSFIVNPGVLDHFSFSSVDSPQTAGVPFSITITAQDAWNHTVTSFGGTVSLGTSAGTIAPAVTSAFTDGVWTGSITVTGAGFGKTVSASSDGTTGTGNPFDVEPGTAVAFTVTAPAITSAGNPFDITVTAKDSYDNTAAGYLGTVHFASTDSKVGVVLPPEYAFSAEDKGVRIFTGVVLETAGTQTITAADVTVASISGTSGSIAVSPAGAAKVSVTAPATAIAGSSFDLTVSVKDAYDNDITGYVGTIGFTTSDQLGIAPQNYTFVSADNGRHTFVGLTNLKTSGIQTITAADLANPAVTGTSGSIAVSPAAAQTLNFNQQPVTTMVGEPISPPVSVSLVDQYGNLATGSTAEVTVRLSESGHSGTLTGTTTVNTVDGIAAFPGLAIGTAGNGFILSATSGSLAPATSVIFDIILGTCGKPATLTVPATNTTGTVPLAWGPSDVDGVTYVLEQSRDGGVFTEVYSGTATTANITVTANGTYTYRIKAMKDGYVTSGYTAGSNNCRVEISCPAPASLTVPPTNSTGTISLTWSASDLGGVTYIIEQSKDGGAFTVVQVRTGTSATVTVSDNGTYAFRIKATKGGYLDSSYTLGNTGCVVFLACAKPALLTIPATNSIGTIPISWSASDVGGVTYILEQSKDGGAFTEVYSGFNTSANIVVSGNGTYAYRVKAVKANYVSSDYTVGNNSCVVRLVCKKPAAVTVPSGNSTGTFWVTWNESDVSGATYTLEQSKNGEPFTTVYTGTNLSTSIAVTTNGTYSYRVRAAKEGYETSDYTVGSNGCVVHLACGKPALLTVPATNSTGIFWINWRESDVSGATYVLEQSKDGASFAEVYNGTNTAVSIAITSNGTYTYRIKAMKTGYDTSDYTAGSNGCVVHLACGKPASVTVPAANSTGTFWVSWAASDVSGATYILEQSREGEAFTQIYSGTVTSANVTVAANGTYTYRVKALKAGYDTSDYTIGNTGCIVHLACGKPASVTVPLTNSTGTISISWSPSDVSGASYVLEQSRAGGAFTEVYTGTNTSASVSVSGNDTYFYRVKALKTGYDTSDYTAGGNGCTVYLVCGKPAVVTVPAANSTGTISVSWSASDVSGVTYILEQSKDGSAFTEVHTGTSTAASITVTVNGTYTYRVKAVKTNYVSSDFTVGGTGCLVRLVCGKPATVTVPAANSTGIISIAWGPTDVTGATYILEQSLDNGPYIEVYSGTNTAASINVAGNGTYTYRVKAMKTNYESSEYAFGSTGCIARLACGKPSAITVPNGSSTGTFWISWRESDVQGVTYVLEQSLDGGGFAEVYRGLNLSASITVTANGTYHYRVKAIKTGYESSDYTAGSNGCAVRLVCGNPASLTVPTVNTSGTFWVTWSASDVVGSTYVLEQSKNGETFSEVYIGTNTSASISVTANGTYTYRVKAMKNNYEASNYTMGDTGCVVNLACGKPGALNVPGANSSGSFWITWSASDVVGSTYIVEQSKDGGAYSEVYSGGNNATNVRVVANGTYTYRVKAIKAGYEPSDWTAGSTSCIVRMASGVKITVPNQGDMYFPTIAAAVSGIPEGTSVLLSTWTAAFAENIDLNKNGTTLTIGSAFDESYTNPTGPTVINGTVVVTAGTLVADNLLIR